MKLPIDKLPLTKDELIVTVVTALLVEAFEKIGEKLALGVFWIGVTCLKFAKNQLVMPLVRLGDKENGRLITSYQELIKLVVKKCSRGFFYFNNNTLYWAVQGYIAPAVDRDYEETKAGKDENGEQKVEESK